MRVVIVGASRFGAAIADKLIEDGHEIVIVDQRRERLEEISTRFDCGMMEGDGTMPSVLKEVFRGEEDAFVAVTNASEDNILACLVARTVGFGRVIPQIVSSELLNVCRALELQDVINPHATVAETIAEALEDNTALDHDTVLGNELALLQVTVPAQMDGQSLGELDLPKDVRVIARTRDEEETLAEESMEMAEGDVMLLVLDRERQDKVEDMFRDRDAG